MLILGIVASLGLLSWSGHLQTDLLRSLWIILTIACGNWGWTLCNEYCDVEVDRVNKPLKPLPSGQVSMKGVNLLGSILLWSSFSANLVLVFFFDWMYVLGFVAHLTSFMYNAVTKGLFGNFCMAATYGLGAFLSLYPNHLLFCLPFALFTLAHNLNNQYQDVKAEKTAGVVTVPQQFGAVKTCFLSWSLLVVAFLVFLDIYQKTQYSPLLIFLAVSVTTIISTCSMLVEEKSYQIIENVARRLGRLLLIIGFLAMILQM